MSRTTFARTKPAAWFVMCLCVQMACAEMRIGISLPSHVAEWSGLNKTIVEKLEADGAECVSLSCRLDPALQQEQCEYLLRQNIHCLVLCAQDPRQSVETIKRARLVGVPVLAFEQLIPNCELDLYVGYDYELAGRLQADALLAEKKGRYALIGGPVDDLRERQIRAGQAKALRRSLAVQDVEIFASEWTSSSTVSSAFEIVESLFVADTGIQVEAILGSSAAVAQASADLLARHGVTHQIPITGFGLDHATRNRIRNGTQLMSIYAPRQGLADTLAKAGLSLAKRKAIVTRTTVHNGLMEIPAVLIRPRAIDKTNVDTPSQDRIPGGNTTRVP